MTTLEKVASILIAVALIGSIWASAVLMRQQNKKETHKQNKRWTNDYILI